jgi:hypothetical protein
MPRPNDEQIIEALDLCLTSLWSQHDALQKLAAHYPEAHHVLSSPRKPDAIIILERLRYSLADTPAPRAGGSDDGD